MRYLLSIFLCVAIVRGGPNDTLDQLKAAITNVLFEDQIFQSPLVTELGSVPTWLSGESFQCLIQTCDWLKLTWIMQDPL